MHLVYSLFWIIIQQSLAKRYFYSSGEVLEYAEQYVGEALHNNTANSTGWIFLKIITSHDYSDEEQFEAAGYLEGYLTYKEIYAGYMNFINTVQQGKHYLPKSIGLYVENQYQWMKEQSKQETSFWRQVKMLLIQLEAMYEGYTKQTKHTFMELSFWQFYYLTNMGDLNDLVPSAAKITKFNIGNCNSFYKDGIMAHNTFNIYSLMLRVFKSYHFHLHDNNVVNNLTFSSRPGDLESKDDFVILWDTEMVLVETSFNNYDNSNYEYYHFDSLPSWIRVNVASRLAKSPIEWAQLFEIARSGTHNNQWFITDFSDIYLIEEAYSLYKSINFTDYYNQQGYVASYNVPFDQEIQERLNYTFGYGKNYTTDPRAIQFKQQAPKVKTIEAAGYLIRYNIPTSEFDNCNGAISPRCDVDAGYTFGGIDGKVIDLKMLKQRKVRIISSPTYDNQTYFSWSAYPNVPHMGMANDWQHPWLLYDDEQFLIT